MSDLSFPGEKTGRWDNFYFTHHNTFRTLYFSKILKALFSFLICLLKWDFMKNENLCLKWFYYTFWFCVHECFAYIYIYMSHHFNPHKEKRSTAKILWYNSNDVYKMTSGEHKLCMNWSIFEIMSHGLVSIDWDDYACTTIVIFRIFQYPIWLKHLVDIKSHFPLVF